MKITVLTIFPEMFSGFKETSIIKRAIEKGLIEIDVVDFRKYTLDKHNRVDDYPFGGGKGMILMCQPILDCLKEVKTGNDIVVLMDPTGEKFDQTVAHRYADKIKLEDKHLILVCGHYEGFDYRVYDYIDAKISIGDYILTGGELASMVVTDAIVRLLPNVISEGSTDNESFENGLLEYPQYTHPVSYDNKDVPEVLTSGHHENIRKYNLYQSLKRTYKERKDLLDNRQLTKEEREFLDKIKLEENGGNYDD